MEVSALSATVGTATTPAGPRDRNAPVTAEDIRKVAAQFEAIIVRQLLKPAIEPIMNGGATAKGGAGSGSGGGVYGYLLTDVLAGSLSQGTGLGLGAMMEQQLTPAALKAAYAEEQRARAAAPASSP